MRPGDRIAGFELRERLGRGSFGWVYRAVELATGREIALKLIPLLGEDADLVEAERKGAEIQKLVAAQCEAIAAVYDIDEEEDQLFIAMEYIPGEDLGALLEREKTLPERRAAAIAAQLCRILEIFHGGATDGSGRPLRIVHGDLKPENVRLQAGDRVRLLDFGTAKRLRQESNETHLLFGTIAYSAPEALKGEAVDLRSDLWAISVVLYQLVAGGLPFPGRNDSEKRQRLLSGQPPEPLTAPSSRGLRLLLDRALAIDPTLRFPSARALREELERLVDGRSLEVEKTAARDLAEKTRRMVEEPPPLATQSAKPPMSGQPKAIVRPRVGRPWSLALVACMLALVGLQIHAWQVGKAIDTDLRAGTQERIDMALARLMPWSWIDPLGLLAGPRERLREGLERSLVEAFEAARAEAAPSDAVWQGALTQLERLARVAPGDSFVASRTPFSHGMLALVAAERHWHGGDLLSARTQLGTAISHFREAGRQAPEWAAPHFGVVQAHTHQATAVVEQEPLVNALKDARLRSSNLTDHEREVLISGYLALTHRRHRDASVEESTDARAQALHQACKDLQEAAPLCREVFSTYRHRCGEELLLLRRVIEEELRKAGFYIAC